MQSGIRRCSILISVDPQGLKGLEGGAVRRPRTGVEKCRRCSSARASAVVCCKTPAPGLWRRARGEKCGFTAGGRVHPRRHMQHVQLSVVPGDLDIQKRKALRGVGYSWKQQDKGQRGNLRWEVGEIGKQKTFILLIEGSHVRGKEKRRLGIKAQEASERNKNIITVSQPLA